MAQSIVADFHCHTLASSHAYSTVAEVARQAGISDADLYVDASTLTTDEEIEEAASIDGYGIFPTYFKVVLPMSIPMMITIFMFSFSWQWTDTFYSGMFFSELKVLSNTIFTMTSAFHSGNFAGNYSTSSLLQTGVLMAIVPLIIIYIFAQRKIIGGIERSGLVG